MKNMIKILIAISILSSIAYALEIKQLKISFSNFLDLNNESYEGKLGKQFSYNIENEVVTSKNKFLKIRDRNIINKYLDEMVKVQLGIQSENTLKKENLKVDYITVGSVAYIPPYYVVDSRVVNLRTWEIILSDGVSHYYKEDINRKISQLYSKALTKDYVNRLNANKDFEAKRNSIVVVKFKEQNYLKKTNGYDLVLSEMLNSELSDYREFKVIERMHLGSIFDELTLEMSGIFDNDDSNKALTENKIKYQISGEINVLEDVTTINYKIINTENSEIFFSGYEELSSIQYLRTVANKIAYKIDRVANNKVKLITIDSNPKNAEIYIDDNYFGVTPYKNYIENGDYELTVFKPGYQLATQNVEINKDSENLIEIKLNPALSQQEDSDENLITKEPGQKTLTQKISKKLIIPYKQIAELNGHKYYLAKEKVSWPIAKKICEKYGGHLATITSRKENSILIKALKRQDLESSVWIGLTDRKTEGKFEWVTGEKFRFSRWAHSEPNNGKWSGRDIGEQNYGCFSYAARFLYWDDEGDNNKFPFLLEIVNKDTNKETKNQKKTPYQKIAEYNGHEYYISKEKVSWVTAKKLSEKFGGYLLTITNPLENKVIRESLKKYRVNDNIWLGLTDKRKEGDFRWVSGETYKYKRWMYRQPDNGNSERGNFGEQDYAFISTGSGLSRWDDGGLREEMLFVVEVEK